MEGVDLLRIREGRIVRNDAYVDGLGLARQIGALPPAGSPGERRLTGAFNARTRLARRLASAPAERIADGVWLLRGGLPGRTMNIFFIEDDGGGVTMFDAGIVQMTSAAAALGARMGGIHRVVLGHAHEDHRGAAPGLGAPVHCHALDRADAETDGGRHYMELGRLKAVGRIAYPRLLSYWDGGPVPIAATVEEGDEVSGFRVVHLPGHAPGLIGLFRERDGVALTTDCFYTLDPQTGRHGPPRVPHPAFNRDTEQARASIRKLADLRPRVAWPGHADPVTGDVRGQLLAAADAP
jgi:glyoxylase-like metal-dependent hydrolase (beta-lactamase superfamily II)